MPGMSLTKNLHRLMRRIGPLTEGQASIDDVNWEDGTLTSMGVTIRPNASYYKGGRFKFTINMPQGGLRHGASPYIWCETEIHHPNIDTFRSKSKSQTRSNICLDVSGAWNPTHGLEGIVLGILFLMHNPNLDDALVGGFPSGDPEGVAIFAEDVKTYMATGACNEKTYDIDFRVIDGEFKDLNSKNGDEPASDKETNRKQRKFKLSDLFICGTQTGTDKDEGEEDIVPIRFVRVDTDPEYDEGEGCFYIILTNQKPDESNNNAKYSANGDNDTSFSEEDIGNRHSVSKTNILESGENTGNIIVLKDCTTPAENTDYGNNYLSETTERNGCDLNNRNDAIALTNSTCTIYHPGKRATSVRRWPDVEPPPRRRFDVGQTSSRRQGFWTNAMIKTIQSVMQRCRQWRRWFYQR